MGYRQRFLKVDYYCHEFLFELSTDLTNPIFLIDHISDDSIVDAIINGDAQRRSEAMSKLYKAYFAPISDYILKNSGNKDDSADVFQDSLVVFYLKVRKGEYKRASGIGTYLYAIARNLWLKKLRKARFDLTKLEVEESYTFNEDDLFQESQLTVREALEQIGENCKRLLTDFYFAKLSVSQLTIAYGLGSDSATRNKKYRCMQRLMAFVNENKLKRSDFLNA